jgi:hypothetical protein
MATTFKEFSDAVVLKSRGETRKTEIQHSSIKLHVNNMDVSFPNQLFINGEFIDSESGAVLDSVNPSDESVICQVNCKFIHSFIFVCTVVTLTCTRLPYVHRMPWNAQYGRWNFLRDMGGVHTMGYGWSSYNGIWVEFIQWGMGGVHWIR